MRATTVLHNKIYESLLKSTGAAPVGYRIPHAIYSSYYQQRRDPTVNFSDVAIVKLRSGDGGNGKISFTREASKPFGPADGGDGGKGGGVYVQAVPGMTSLHSIRHIYKAESGRAGGSSQLSGKNGENAILQVPVGTTVRWSPALPDLKSLFATDQDAVVYPRMVEPEQARDPSILLERHSYHPGEGWIFKEQEEEQVRQQGYFRDLAKQVVQSEIHYTQEELSRDLFPADGIDLETPGEPVQLLAGGSGGQGNMHFASGMVRNPRFAKLGRSGLEATFIFELRLLADLGLVGMPNAGKSTLLRAISRARPRVGSWEFTTLSPSVGTIDVGIDKPSFTVADIPGIIEGASANKGLGLGFLRHIERSGGVCFVIALDRPDPIADFEMLKNELGARLQGKNVLVVCTKADLEGTQPNYIALAEHLGNNGDIVPCSATENGNIEAVIHLMSRAAGKM